MPSFKLKKEHQRYFLFFFFLMPLSLESALGGETLPCSKILAYLWGEKIREKSYQEEVARFLEKTPVDILEEIKDDSSSLTLLLAAMTVLDSKSASFIKARIQKQKRFRKPFYGPFSWLLKKPRDEVLLMKLRGQIEKRGRPFSTRILGGLLPTRFITLEDSVLRFQAELKNMKDQENSAEKGIRRVRLWRTFLWCLIFCGTVDEGRSSIDSHYTAQAQELALQGRVLETQATNLIRNRLNEMALKALELLDKKEKD